MVPNASKEASSAVHVLRSLFARAQAGTMRHAELELTLQAFRDIGRADMTEALVTAWNAGAVPIGPEVLSNIYRQMYYDFGLREAPGITDPLKFMSAPNRIDMNAEQVAETRGRLARIAGRVAAKRSDGVRVVVLVCDTINMQQLRQALYV